MLTSAERQKEYRARKKIKSICLKCNTPVLDQTLCESHRLSENKRHRTLYNSNLEKQRLRSKNKYEKYKEFILERQALYKENFPEIVKETKTRYRNANKEKIYFGRVLANFNLSKEKYFNLWNKQNGLCAIKSCGKALDSGRRPDIDHDRTCCSDKKSCGKCIRGLLCGNHNKALGLVNDNVDQLYGLIEYLTKKSYL